MLASICPTHADEVWSFHSARLHLLDILGVEPNVTSIQRNDKENVLNIQRRNITVVVKVLDRTDLAAQTAQVHGLVM